MDSIVSGNVWFVWIFVGVSEERAANDSGLVVLSVNISLKRLEIRSKLLCGNI